MVRTRTPGILVTVLVALVAWGALVFRGPAGDPGHRVVLEGTPTVEADGLPSADVSAAAVEGADLDRLMDVVLVTLLLALGATAASLGGLMGADAVSSSRRWSVEALLGAPLSGLLRNQVERWRRRLLWGLILGLVAAMTAFGVFARQAPPGISTATPSPRSVATAVVLTVLAVLAIAVRPVHRLYRSRGRLALALRLGGASETAAARFQRMMWVTGQLAAAVALVTAAGLLGSADEPLAELDRGRQIAATFVATGDSVRDAGLRAGLLEMALGRLQADPALVAESLATPGAWLDRGPETATANECGRCTTGGMPHPVHVAQVRHHVVMPGFTTGRGLDLLDGRRLNGDDGPEGEPVVLINQAYARAHFQDGPAVGKRVALGGLAGDWHQVVGVVSDVPSGGLGRTGSPFAVYFSALQHPPVAVEFVAQHLASGEELDLAAAGEALQVAIATRTTGDLELEYVAPAVEEVERIHGTSAWLAHATGVLGWVAAVAALLAVWFAVAGQIEARTAELGTRAALGAEPRALWALVLGESARLGTIGVGLGLWGATAVVGIVGPGGGPLFDAG
ncbi:MAG: hypothetical protein HKO53_06065, partial [Gemmatimonadetes bacterium]|nr:hypothetical protein [Gemmatimonadota bacterium]